MREKIILRDFTILLVCPSQKWSSIERRVLLDSSFLRNIGCNPVILCFKGSQIDIEAEAEDISRVYINSKISFYPGMMGFFFELRKLILEKRFDIVHCYSLFSMWLSAFILGTQQKTPLFLTFNQNEARSPGHIIAKWLIKRVDYIFTFSKEVEDYLKATLPIPPKKLRNLGVGLEVVKSHSKSDSGLVVGCVINNVNELKNLYFPVKVFRLLKDCTYGEFEYAQLQIFLGPRIFQKERAKNVLTELDYEFYKGDIHLLNLKGHVSHLKEIDVFFGTAFDEPINDYEVLSLLNQVPVLFPRTAMRQSLLQNYPGIGESYLEEDLREARGKLLKILKNSESYRSFIGEFVLDIFESHGLESYAARLQEYYETAFAKRLRLLSKKRQKD